MKYFLYRHIRKDKDEVFYVGIGTKRSETNYSRAFSKNLRNKWWENIVNTTKYEVEIVLESNDRDFIFEREIEFITLYGRRDLGLGTLCNLTNGGEGSVGTIVSKETRLKHSKRSKGNTYRLGTSQSEETKLLMSMQRVGKKKASMSDVGRENCRNGQIGSKKTKETIQKFIERSKGPKACNRKPCKLINTITEEEWVGVSMVDLYNKSSVPIHILGKLKFNRKVSNQYNHYKFYNL